MNKKSEIVIVNDKLYHLGIKKSDLAENIFKNDASYQENDDK